MNDRFTVPATQTYHSLDGTESRRWKAGDVVHISTAVRFGMAGAAAQQAANAAELAEQQTATIADVEALIDERGAGAAVLAGTSSWQGSSTTPWPIPYPAEAEAGDLLIAWIVAHGDSSMDESWEITPPDGWTEVHHEFYDGDVAVGLCWTVLAETPSGTADFAFAGPDGGRGVIAAYAGAEPADPVAAADVRYTEWGSPGKPLPTVVRTDATQLLVTGFGMNYPGTSDVAWVDPTGTVRRVEYTAASSLNGAIANLIADGPAPTTTAGLEWSEAGNLNGGAVFALLLNPLGEPPLASLAQVRGRLHDAPGLSSGQEAAVLGVVEGSTIHLQATQIADVRRIARRMIHPQPVFVGATSYAQASDDNWSVPLHADIEADDVIVILCESRDPDSTLLDVTPDGWTAVSGGSLTDGLRYGSYTKVADGSEAGGTVEIDTGSTPGVAFSFVMRNVATSGSPSYLSFAKVSAETDPPYLIEDIDPFSEDDWVVLSYLYKDSEIYSVDMPQSPSLSSGPFLQAGGYSFFAAHGRMPSGAQNQTLGPVPFTVIGEPESGVVFELFGFKPPYAV